MRMCFLAYCFMQWFWPYPYLRNSSFRFWFRISLKHTPDIALIAFPNSCKGLESSQQSLVMWNSSVHSRTVPCSSMNLYVIQYHAWCQCFSTFLPYNSRVAQHSAQTDLVIINGFQINRIGGQDLKVAGVSKFTQPASLDGCAFEAWTGDRSEFGHHRTSLPLCDTLHWCPEVRLHMQQFVFSKKKNIKTNRWFS